MRIRSSGPSGRRGHRGTSTSAEPRPAPAAASRRRRKSGAGRPNPLAAWRNSRGVVIGAVLAAVLLLAGGGTAFAMDKRITLTVDGESRTVHTFGGTVQEILDDEGITLSERDAVAPALATSLGAGAEVMVRTGREFTLAVDGEDPAAHWVTALTVGEALDQIGMGAQALSLSEERSAEVPVAGLSVEARSARHLVLLRDRVRLEVDTNAETIGEVIEASGIELGEHDIVEPALEEEPLNGMVVKITHLTGGVQTKEVPIEAETEERENPELPKDEKKVVTEPEDGVKEITYATVLKEGEETDHVLSEKVTKEPVNGVTEIGTKEPEVNPNVGGPADSLNWAGLAQCESTGNAGAVNPAGYYGLYQFSLPTWSSTGGTGLPSEASPDEQTMRAKKLYDMVGGNWQSQWPECGVHLFD
ncbi:resuscitation-promoting factor [Nocardiopsis ansamitocini]|uniref:resuscitation-promoting factor n=1 Tax=Nocardiopsis ansamitocini TaxID=1670832 RepID=UPI0025552914|nr:resuscitation-promoting factor [Nocardiopsis ansamitocini]